MATLTKNANTIRNPTTNGCELAVDSDTAGEKLYAAVRLSHPYVDDEHVIIREGRIGAVWTGEMDSVVGENVFSATGFDATKPFHYGFAQENWQDAIYTPDVDGLTGLPDMLNFSEGGVISCYDNFTFRYRWEAVESVGDTAYTASVMSLASGAKGSPTTRLLVRKLGPSLDVRIGTLDPILIPWTWEIGEIFDVVVRVSDGKLTCFWKDTKYEVDAPEGTISNVQWINIPGTGFSQIMRSFTLINAAVPDDEIGDLP